MQNSLTEEKQQSNFNSIQIIESQYFGTVNWYKLLFKHTHAKIAQYEAYPKTSFRNRTIVAGSNGLIVLSVPLQKGRSQKSQTCDVSISYDQDWREQHWRTIISCYGKSPFFEFYEEGLANLFQKRFHYLLDLNQATQEWALKQLKSNFSLSYCLEEATNFNCAFTDLRDLVKPNNFQLVKEPVIYTQVFEDRIGFQPNLSILDLLNCNGPASKNLL